ncbi:MAG: tetratricopeptide repeat protein [Gammaproteobacteria bacterium]|nr:tetratricopeptide repeat protein [Gammaproteobacteria bacterium]
MRRLARFAITRALLVYGIGCFVVLQLLDVLRDALAIPVTADRWIMLLMLAIAPLLALGLALRNSRVHFIANSKVAELDEDTAVFMMGGAEIDTATRQIRFDGKAADVQPKVFDLIEFLIRARERVVSKDELFDVIWPSVVVSEASLTQTIKRARDLFRQNGFDNDVIRTVSRKGYQFDYPITGVAESENRTSRHWLTVVMPTGLVTSVSAMLAFLVLNSTDVQIPEVTLENEIRANSLAVLPFTNLTADEQFSYFSDGLTETVTNSLTTVRGLRVIARASSFSFRDTESDFATIGNELNVAHVVQGTVQRDAENLRITAKLVRVRDGYQAWTQVYNRQFDDIFSVQDDISRSIVEQMSAVLTASLTLAQPAIYNEGSADYSEAYRLLLLGRELHRNGSNEGLLAAEAEFRKALELRPEYPEALVDLSSIIRYRTVTGDLPRESGFSEAVSLANRALQINPDYAAAYVQLGEIQHRHFWAFAEAKSSYQRALELNPGSASAHSAYSRFLSKSGEFAAAVNEATVALDLDPLSSSSATSLAIRLIRARELEKARTVIDEIRNRFPDLADLPWLETNWHIRNQSYSEALQWIALEELDYLRLSLSAVTLFYLERTEQARQALDDLIESDPEGAAFQIAEVFAHWNQPDEAFEWLEKAFSLGDPGLAEMYSSVNLENLYADERFFALALKVGLPQPPASML